MEVPIYIINGFLDGGKTSFIKETLADENFTDKEKTLIILCEDGTSKIKADFLKEYNSELVLINDECEFTDLFMKTLNEKYKPDRIMIECNGMWSMDTMFDNLSEDYFEIVQVITIINEEKFHIYLGEIKDSLDDYVSDADVVIINRCKGNNKIFKNKNIIKFLNISVEIYFEDENGEDRKSTRLNSSH